MWGIATVLISCCLFIHLGLGQAIENTLHIHCVLLQCVKCLTFWSVLSYSLFLTNFRIEECVLISFTSSYTSLWIDLLFTKLAIIYETIYKDMGSENHKKD